MNVQIAMNRLDAYLRRHFEAEPRMGGDKIKVVAMQAAELDLFEMVKIVEAELARKEPPYGAQGPYLTAPPLPLPGSTDWRELVRAATITTPPPPLPEPPRYSIWSFFGLWP